MRVRPRFVSCGVNRVVNALDWGPGGLIAYGGHRIVCVYDPETAEVVATLIGHTAHVNCVKWLPAGAAALPGGAALLLSGAADNSIRVWAWLGREAPQPWACIAQLQGHQSPVTCLAVQPLLSGQLLLATTSADPVVRLWRLDHSSCSAASSDGAGGGSSSSAHAQTQRADGDASCSCSNGSRSDQPLLQLLQERFGAAAWHQEQLVHVGAHIQHCVALAALPEDPCCMLMATGGTDSTVRLFVMDSSSSSSGADGVTAGTALLNGNGVHGSTQQQQQQQQQQSGHVLPPFRMQCQLKGHENWVKGVAFSCVREPPAAAPEQQQQQPGRLSLLLASAGQDRYGRIWCISTDASRISAGAQGGVAPGANGSSGSGSDALRSLITRYAPRPHLCAGSHTYWVTLDALLIGHEDWLNSVTWRPLPAAAAAAAGAVPDKRDVTLLSASQDRSMMLWGFDAPSGLWISESIGDAGSSCLGFYGGAFSPTGDQLVAHGFTGALHLWQQQQQQQQQQRQPLPSAAAAAGPGAGGCGSRGGRCMWEPRHALGGHYGAVQDLAWGADGGCLQSVAADQTARLFTAVRGHWFELARTQVHGHDFSCLANIPSSSSNDGGGSSSSGGGPVLPPACLQYVSGSEEKVLRVFEAPQAFTDSLVAVRGSQSADAAAATAAALAAAAAAVVGGAGGTASLAAGSSGRGRALGASVAALGLSNKAVYVDDDGNGGDAGGGVPGRDAAGGGPGNGARAPAAVGAEAYAEGPDCVPCALPAVVAGPPLEEHLAQNTLWPEVRKLYGHGNDVYCVAASPCGRLLASACRAQSGAAAAVWVWEVGSWRGVAQLPGHTLTVTALAFSPDGRHLLSGSRDRSFSVWRAPAWAQGGNAAAGGPAGGGGGSSDGGFALVGRLKAAHSRIIWGVTWSHDGRHFATGARDQAVKLWALADVGGSGPAPQRPLLVLPPFPAGVTAVALAPRHACEAAAAAAAATAAAGSDAAGSGGSVHLLAVGLEDGRVQVWRLVGADGQGSSCEQAWASEPWEQHAGAVKRLCWGPACVQRLCGGSDGCAAAGPAAAPAVAPPLHLASCGEDHSVRVFEVGFER